jgi:hypothetical protein
MLSVIERPLQSSIPTLSNAEPCKCSNKKNTRHGGTAINTDVCPISQIIPFLRQGLCWLLIYYRLCG